MKIKLDKTFLNLKGEELKRGDNPIKMGEILAEIILTPAKTKNGFRPLKSFELAKKMDKCEEVELDAADLIQIKELVENFDGYGFTPQTTMIKAQLLIELSEK